MKTKTAYPTNEIAHLWAHQSTNGIKYAKNSAGNFWFEEETIYSYGRHFPIATLYKGKVLFTTNSYLNTTAKHIYNVRAAVSHKEIILCLNPMQAFKGEHTANIGNFEEIAKEAAGKLKNARKPEKYLFEIRTQRELLKEYVEFFELPPETITNLNFINIVSSDGAKEANEQEQKRLAEAKRLREIEEEKQRIENLKHDKIKLRKWRNFDPGYINSTPHFYELTGTYLRLEVFTQIIETSKGITIPVNIAERFYKWLKRTLKNGDCDGECKHEILGYPVERVDKTGVKIGCHDITWKEISKIAAKLNWQ